MPRRPHRPSLFEAVQRAAPPDCVGATIDGAARGNPGPAAYGVVFEDGSGRVKEQLSGRLGKTTNNVAEYRALLAALAHAAEQGWRALKVRTDSELLANQLQGRYKVKSPDLKPLHEEARRLIATLEYFAVEAVSRKLTRAADKLANAALDLRPATLRLRSGQPRAPRPVKTKREGHGFSRAKKHAEETGASAPEGKTLRAVYKDGVLIPCEPLNLPDGTELQITIRPRSGH